MPPTATRAFPTRALVASLVASLAACDPADPATPDAGAARCVGGMTIACACTDGTTGAQTCGADAFYGPCTCTAPPDAAVDASPDASPDASLDAAPDTSSDALPPDDVASPDASRLDAADAPEGGAPDAGPGDAAVDDVCEGDCAPGVEQRPPWRVGGCTLWTRVPPAHTYLAPLTTAEGTFAASSEDLVVARNDASGWSLALLQQDFTYDLGWFVGLVSGSGWVAAVGTDGITNGGRVFIRRGGRWVDVTPTPRTLPSFEAAWATGANLYAAGDGRVMEYDGAAWRAVDGAMAGPGYGDRAGMYTRVGAGLYWFDGARSMAVPTPAPGEIRAVAGASRDEVYAIGNHLYRARGATLTQEPDVDCGGPAPRYAQLASAPGRLVLVADCGGAARAWSREGGAWTPLGALPAAGAVAVGESGSLGLAAGFQLWVRPGASAAWRMLPEGSPAPPSGVVAATSPTDAWSLSASGVARLAGDTWTVAAPPAGFATPTNAWAAPDGTLFVATTNAVWRHAGGRWTRDAFSSTLTTHLAGRTASDVWVGEGGSGDARLRHWNGAVWESPPGPPCARSGPDVPAFRQIAVAGSRITVASCGYGGVAAVYHSDGGAWSALADAPPSPILTQFGPEASPGAFAGTRHRGQLRTEAGWAPWQIPAPWDPLVPNQRLVVLRGSLPAAAVTWEGTRLSRRSGYFSGGFVRYDGVSAARLTSWPAVHAAAGDTGTDARWVVAPATCGRADVPEAAALARCSF